MQHRLADESRTISWTESRKIRVGYYLCICGLETPEPNDEQLLEFAQADTGNFAWPGTRSDNIMPVGWSDDSVHGLLCPACTAAKDAALAARRKKKK